jgi:hypothetical protein
VRNLLILGSGRSGTSMTAALFREGGAYQGENAHVVRAANPYGFYEDPEINRLNDRVLLRMLASGWRRPLWRIGSAVHRHPNALWLAAPRALRRVPLAPDWVEAMRKHLSRQPICLKDPRWGLTLPLWRPYLPPDTRFLVVFRDPDTTVDSMLREARETYRPPIPLTARFAYASWFRMYRRLLRDLSREGEWLFVRYEQILCEEALPALEAFAETRLCTTQIDAAVSRAQPNPQRAPGARRARRLFQALLERADADLRRWSPRGD